MAAGSVESALASALYDVKGRMAPFFTQKRAAAAAAQFPDGLLGNEPRKTGWMRAQAAGDPGPWRQQEDLAYVAELVVAVARAAEGAGAWICDVAL